VAPGGVELRGRDGAKQFFAIWANGVPDNEITVTDEYVCGNVVVQQAVFSGTHTGGLMVPSGDVIPAIGRSLSAPFVDLFEVGEDQITAERLYFDQLELLTQLGLMPDAATAST
jgi:predicted ester cyclase